MRDEIPGWYEPPFAGAQLLVRITADFRTDQFVDDDAGVVTLEPAVSGDGAFAGAVGAGVHHNDAVAGAQKEFRLANGPHTVVGLAVKEQDPKAVGILGADFPAAEERAIWCADVEVFAGGPGGGEGRVGFADQIRGEFAANGVDQGGAGQPPHHGGEDRREEEENERNADQAAHRLSDKVEYESGTAVVQADLR